jgi:SAM-dependent methyltransferase
MPEYSIPPLSSQPYNEKIIHSFVDAGQTNIHVRTVNSFGQEWTTFSKFSNQDIDRIASDYFDLLDLQALGDKVILDVGCGTGRWAKFLSKWARFVEAVDPSDAVYSAVNLLKTCSNARVTRASVDHLPFRASSFDLVYSLGVLHHVPNTKRAIEKCVDMIKPGGQLLLYLYYNLENRGFGYRVLFQLSNLGRKMISRLPGPVKLLTCDLMAAIVYWPLVQVARVVHIFSSRLAERLPLSYYQRTSFQIMRNDALDRFGTPLEKRFSREEITGMLTTAGLTNIRFSEQRPYWHVIAEKP